MNNEPSTMNLLDFIFPKYCVSCGRVGAYICKNCFSKIEYIDNPICPECSRQAIGGKTHPGCKKRYGLDGLVVACRYKGPVRAAISKIKYRFAWDIHNILVDLIADSLWRFNLPNNLILVPIPLHSHRKNWRGFNQAELLAKDLAKRFGEKCQSDILIRDAETKTQVGLSREERRKNIQGVFRLNKISDVKGQNIILVDDVYTTGSTMKEVCKVFKHAGAGEVWAMVAALD